MRRERGKSALLVTYTMDNPFAVGVFFRALRVARQLHQRGWRTVVCNCGPIPADPKVEEALTYCRIIPLEMSSPEQQFRTGLALFRGAKPDVIVFGEYPFPFMEPYFEACRALVRPPIIMLDQYYGPAHGRLLRGVDHLLLYGLRCVWQKAAEQCPRIRIVPPFISEVADKQHLPVPALLRRMPWIATLGFEPRVLAAGIKLVATLQAPVAVITVSHEPGEAAAMLQEAGVPPTRFAALPLQSDDKLYGLMSASSAVVLANGFMQIAEAIALGCPAISIHRGIGMDGNLLDANLRAYVCFDEPLDIQVRRVEDWISQSPFSEELSAALRKERHGASITADYIEGASGRIGFVPQLERLASQWSRRS
jgi:hypothetical protein